MILFEKFVSSFYDNSKVSNLLLVIVTKNWQKVTYFTDCQAG
jgi:hypothetical protein